MSHYTVLVAADNETELEHLLAPFDENLEVEAYWKDCYCLGRVARTEARRAAEAAYPIDALRAEHKMALNQGKKSLWEDLIAPYKAIEKAVYDIHPLKDKPDKDCEDCHGKGRRQTTYNPNSKWDWKSVGGRWSGLLKLKPSGTEKEPKLLTTNGNWGLPEGFSKNELEKLVRLKQEHPRKYLTITAKYIGKTEAVRALVDRCLLEGKTVFPEHGNGDGGVFNPANTDPGKADWCRAGDVDWEGMQEDRRHKAGKAYDAYHAAMAITDEKARNQALWDAGLVLVEDKEYRCTREEFVERASKEAVTFAFLTQDGQWLERGHMGFWAIVTDENDDYDRKFWAAVKALKPSQRLYVVDCHI